MPSKCADLLHEGDVDLGLIPSIEYLRGPVEAPHTYRIVPGVVDRLARSGGVGRAFH